jgi:hypothetical protein
VPERSFSDEIHQLRKASGEDFEGEGILAVSKALLQSGISCVGGYQGAPVSALVDVRSGTETGPDRCRGGWNRVWQIARRRIPSIEKPKSESRR